MWVEEAKKIVCDGSKFSLSLELTRRQSEAYLSVALGPDPSVATFNVTAWTNYNNICIPRLTSLFGDPQKQARAIYCDGVIVISDFLPSLSSLSSLGCLSCAVIPRPLLYP